MHHLLQALSCHLQFVVRGLLRLLDKRMQNDDSLPNQILLYADNAPRTENSICEQTPFTVGHIGSDRCICIFIEIEL